MENHNELRMLFRKVRQLLAEEKRWRRFDARNHDCGIGPARAWREGGRLGGILCLTDDYRATIFTLGGAVDRALSELVEAGYDIVLGDVNVLVLVALGRSKYERFDIDVHFNNLPSTEHQDVIDMLDRVLAKLALQETCDA